MNILIKPSTISGTVVAPSSKSIMQRAVAASLLKEGRTKILNPSFCQDSMSAIDVAKKLGAVIEIEKDKVFIEGGIDPVERILECGEAGLCIRMFSAIAALSNTELVLTGEDSLNLRPVMMIEKPLQQLGAIVKTNNGFPPIKLRGPIQGGSAVVDGSLSSQFLTGLLLALPKAQQDSVIKVYDLKSKPYVDMTLRLLEDFNIDIRNDNYETFYISGSQEYSIDEYRVEGDWSGASFLLVAGAVGGSVEVYGLDQNSLQADKKILEALEYAGAELQVSPDKVKVRKRELKSFEFDATHCPDLFPPLVALACSCRGTTLIKGVKRLHFKESDRAKVLMREFSSVGVDIKIKDDFMEINPNRAVSGKINSFNDHRIAMAAAITAVNSDRGITIDNFECVSKSYVNFLNDFVSIGGNTDE